ncbi:HAMP domain-containing protein [Leptospira langatensis]|uniref:HAMP domain-containing protein n=1 Tax=Leptospira langatensis TaxID=2484983 RepID=A0A5F1ZT15_9LEPT|nr:SpoIIE family protein phosphatase [Leptospira langatensis]TGK02819.1 HAMP domain-containing protein [Leptospira langatensis]TGL39976.1 HAMP domain-containing protein [Leptospira langatensis]
MDPFFLNFYSFGSILISLFFLYIAFFFLTIKDRSKAAFHLGVCALTTVFHNVGYTWGFISFEEGTIYHRFITTTAPLMSFTQLVGFFIYFPEPRKKGIIPGLIFYWLLYAGVLFVAIFYAIECWNAPRSFVPGSHYWDYEANLFYGYFIYIILFYEACYMVIAIWKAIIETGKERRSVIYILLSYAVITVVPGILNALSRNGTVARATYQQSFNLGMVTGLFLIMIVYVNATKERTTILSRIVGVSLATFFVCYQLVGYSILNGYENSYDEMKRRDSQISVTEDKDSQGLAYIVSYDPQENEFHPERGIKDLRFKKEDELEVRFLREKLLLCNLGNLSADQRLKKSEPILDESPSEFSAYANGVRGFLKSKKKEKVSDSDMDAYFTNIYRKLNIIRNKYSRLPNPSNLKSIQNLLSSEEPGLSETLTLVREDALRAVQSSRPSAEVLKTVLTPLSPIHPTGARIYRGTRVYSVGDPKPKMYLSYYFVPDPKGKIFEVGFNYRDYRLFQHDPSLILVLSMIGTFMVIVFGFRFFFQNAIVKPMDEVVVGLTEVNSGNLEYRLVPRVEDEIGFIARSFNKMARSIQAARKRLQKYADELEEKVEERTKELQATLAEVNELKQQQDGDYFLTSLLIKPLGANKATSENVKVDFLLEQKKKFSFRRFNDEIGGDMNIANQIRLRGRQYTVFLNADAMGKSMQGAGGALVLGAVCESIIERTRIVETMKEQSPERWLKNAFIELHKVFESFEGSMLVSSVIGLIDEESGSLYYINAEHPWTALYRDGKASFIENDLMFRKLGTTGMEGKISVKTFQLQAGDVIVAGSDGRDDLLLGNDEEGGRIINNDEQLFLRLIEEGSADLTKIYEAIKRTGGLTDDLSLVRISFKEEGIPERIREKEKIRQLMRNAKEKAKEKNITEALTLLEEADGLDNRLPEVKKGILKFHIRLKDYPKVAHYAEEYLNIRPVDREVLFIASYAARRAKQFHKAQDFGERLLLREPTNVRNLINLSSVSISLRNYERAKYLILEAQRLEPDNSQVTKIRKMLDTRE